MKKNTGYEEMNLKDRRYENVVWIHVAQDREQATTGFSRITLLHGDPLSITTVNLCVSILMQYLFEVYY
jgi:hypothetical protein